MDIRLPVVSRRRCVQRTALGAAAVPEVNNNAHSRSTSPSPRSGAVPAAPSRRDWAASSAAPRVSPTRRRVVAVGEAVRDEHTSGQVDERERVGELGLMARFGDDELQVRVRHVAGEVLPEPRVVQAGHRHPREPGAAEGEDVVGGVVEQHADVRRTCRVQPGSVEGGEALRLGEQLRMRPDPLAETESGRSPYSSALWRSRAATSAAGSGTSARGGAKGAGVASLSARPAPVGTVTFLSPGRVSSHGFDTLMRCRQEHPWVHAP